MVKSVHWTTAMRTPDAGESVGRRSFASIELHPTYRAAKPEAQRLLKPGESHEHLTGEIQMSVAAR